MTTRAHYAIVTHGRPSKGTRRAYYTSLESARRDLATLAGGSMTDARIVECDSRADAMSADISDDRPVIASR